jgi:tetratricopeptide (TPR) repeat protein
VIHNPTGRMAGAAGSLEAGGRPGVAGRGRRVGQPRRGSSAQAPVALVVALFVAGCAAGPFERGLLFYEQGRYRRALAAFDEAIRTRPTAAAYANRGATRARLGDARGAVADFTQALGLEPDDPEVLFNRGNAHLAAGDPAAADSDFSRALQLRPRWLPAQFNRGLARWRAGDPGGARVDWERAIALAEDPVVRAGLERRIAALGLPGALTTTTELDPRALARRAIEREVAGDRPGAISDLRAALTLERDPRQRAALEDFLRRLDGLP